MNKREARELELRLRLLRMQQEVAMLNERLASKTNESAALYERLTGLTDHVRLLEQSRRYKLGAVILDVAGSFFRLPRRLAGRWARFIALGWAKPRVSEEASIPVAAPTQVDRPKEAELRALMRATDAPEALTNLRIASVLDPFSHASLSPECHLIPLSPEGWAEQINENRPHLLLVESAWVGLQGEWKGEVERAPDGIRSLVASCRQAGIPTVFWNKEDPLHFEAFIETARQFDHVFTTDASCIQRYRQVLGHDRVGLLPFALQPRSHHPVHDDLRADSSVFAGAWYGQMEERSKDFGFVADALMLAGRLVIHDRHDGRGDAHRNFPARYAECLCPGVPYEATPAIYRSHRIGVNLNTIKQSPTMFARRVFELIGCNASIYGNYSLAQHLLFGELTVSSDDPERILILAWEELHAPDSMSHRQRRLYAIRKVLSEHTWAHRLQTVSRVALGNLPDRKSERIWVVAKADDAGQLGRIDEAFRRQRWEGASLLLSLAPGLVLPPGAQRLDEVDPAPDDWVALFHPDDYYGRHYLEDLALARAFTLGDALGKGAWFVVDGKGDVVEVKADNEYRRVGELALRRSLVRVSRLPDALSVLTERAADAVVRGGGLVSLDALGYVENGAGLQLSWIAEPMLDQGVSLGDVEAFVGKIKVEPCLEDADFIDGATLAWLLNNGVVSPGISATGVGSGVEICSLLEDGCQGAMFSAPIGRDRLERGGEVVACLQALPLAGLDVYIDALDAKGERIQRISLWPDVAMRMTLGRDVVACRFAIMVKGHVVCQIGGVHVGVVPHRPLYLPGRGRLLLVSKGYPEAGHPNRGAFQHRRVLACRRLGIGVDVVVIAVNEQQRSYEYGGVLVHICSPATLTATLEISGHEGVIIDPCGGNLEKAGSVVQADPPPLMLGRDEVMAMTARHGEYVEGFTSTGLREDVSEYLRLMAQVPPPTPHQDEAPQGGSAQEDGAGDVRIDHLQGDPFGGDSVLRYMTAMAARIVGKG